MSAGGRTRGGRARALALLLAAAALAPLARRVLAPAAPRPGVERWVGVAREGTVRLYPPSQPVDRLPDPSERCQAPPPPEGAGQLLVAGSCPPRVRPLPLSTRRLLGLPTHPDSVGVADLEALDGVGPQLARRIVAFRRARGGFESVDDLDAVPGVGTARLDTLRAALNPAAQ